MRRSIPNQEELAEAYALKRQGKLHLNILRCERCGGFWLGARLKDLPVQCAICNSRYWNKPRKNKAATPASPAAPQVPKVEVPKVEPRKVEPQEQPKPILPEPVRIAPPQLVSVKAPSAETLRKGELDDLGIITAKDYKPEPQPEAEKPKQLAGVKFGISINADKGTNFYCLDPKCNFSTGYMYEADARQLVKDHAESIHHTRLIGYVDKAPDPEATNTEPIRPKTCKIKGGFKVYIWKTTVKGITGYAAYCEKCGYVKTDLGSYTPGAVENYMRKHWEHMPANHPEGDFDCEETDQEEMMECFGEQIERAFKEKPPKPKDKR